MSTEYIWAVEPPEIIKQCFHCKIRYAHVKPQTISTIISKMLMEWINNHVDSSGFVSFVILNEHLYTPEEWNRVLKLKAFLIN